MKAVLARSSSFIMDLSRRHSFSGERPKVSMNLEMNNHKRISGIRRALSESDIIRSELKSRNMPSRIPEEEAKEAWFWPPPEDTFPVTSCSGKDGENKRIGEYYRELLKTNPTDSLILRNYGKFLHEVEKDAERAEECYGRAILASPEDGELLSLYGNLIWRTQRNEERAQSYFEQSVNASPNDCMVLGSYARFMWELEEEEEEEEEDAMLAAF